MVQWTYHLLDQKPYTAQSARRWKLSRRCKCCRRSGRSAGIYATARARLTGRWAISRLLKPRVTYRLRAASRCFEDLRWLLGRPPTLVCVSEEYRGPHCTVQCFAVTATSRGDVQRSGGPSDISGAVPLVHGTEDAGTQCRR